MKGLARYARFNGWDRCSHATHSGRRCRNAARWRNRATGELVCAIHKARP